MKKIFKRLVSLTLIAFTAISSLAHAATEVDYDRDTVIDMVSDNEDYRYRISAGLLESLDVLKGYEDSVFDRYSDVTRADFAIWTARVLQRGESNSAVSGNVFADVKADHYAASAIKTLKEMNLVSGDGGYFRPNDKITLLEATIILTKMIGHNCFVDIKGGYPTGWIAVADSAGILKNINVNMNAQLTKDSAVELLANTIQADMVGWDLNDIKIEKNRTILSEYFKIYYIDGIVTSNGITGLSTSDARPDSMMVDNMTIDCDKDFAKDYLGYKSRVFYKSDNNEDAKAVYIISKTGNQELKIEGDDAEAEYDTGKNEIRYYNSNKIKKKVALSKNFKVIYNGKADGSYTEILSDLKDMNLRLLDNDNDKKFDVLFITKYRDIVVKSVNTNDGIIYDYYSGNNNWEYGKISDGAYKSVKDKDGNEVKFEDLYSGQVISLASSRDGEYNEAIAIDDSVDGTIKEISEDNKYVIGDREYILSAYYIKYGNQDLYMGASGNFKLDIDGKIAAFTREDDSNLRYGYIDKVWIGEDDRIVVKIYTTNRGVSNYFCAEKLKTGSTTLKDNDTIYNYIADGGPNEAPAGEAAFTSMLVRFTTNKTGEIDRMEFAADEPDFNKNAPKGGFYVYKPRAYRNYKTPDTNFGEDFMINAETVMMEVITDETDLSNKYRKLTLNSFANNDKSTVTAFADSSNPTYASAIVVYKEKSETNFEYNPIAVNKVASKINSDDDLVYTISGYNADGPIELEGEDESTFESVSNGDIISIKRNSEGKVNEVTKIYSVKENELKNPGKNTDYDSICKYELLTPYCVAENTIKFNSSLAPEEITKESQLKQRLVKKPDSVLVLDRESGEKYTMGTINDLITYKDNAGAHDKVFMYVNYTEVRMLVVVKN